MRETSRFVAVPDERNLDLGGAVASGWWAPCAPTLTACGLGRSLHGRRVAVQGLGAMGGRVAALLAREGAVIVASETDPTVAQAVAAKVPLTLVSPDAIYDQEVDLFCPCATSGILTLQTAERLAAARVKGVVGAANNQLATAEVDALLQQLGIRYAPDYAVNSGAIVLAARESLERRFDTREAIASLPDRVEETVSRIFETSDARKLPPGAVADRLADDALVRPRSTERQWWPIR